MARVEERVEDRAEADASQRTAAPAERMESQSDAPLTRAPDLDLIGQYQDSGFKNPPYMIRRPDGQVVQLPQELFLIVENADGTKSAADIAAAVSQAVGKRLRAEDITYLADRRLRPMGVLVGKDGTMPKLSRNDPMLALNLRMAVVPTDWVLRVSSILRPLFLPVVVIPVLLAVAGLDVWLFGFHGVAQSVRQLLYQPLNFLLVLGLVLVSAAFHECGHATACRYGGARPGPLGAGVYIMWPVFYSDVTDAYRLDRAGRLRTDLGGVYFNAVFMLATALAYALTHYELLVLVMFMQNFEIVRQFMPFLRLDGYYVVADLTGVPDIFGRIKPILASFIPGRETARSVDALRPWARAVVTVWAFVTVALLLYLYGVMLAALPRVLATTWSSLGLTVGRLQFGWAHGDPLSVVVDAVQLVLLVVPVAGLLVSLARWGWRLARAGWRRTEERPGLRIAAAVVALGAGLLFLLSLLPYPGRYTPIGPHDRGVIQDTPGPIANVFLEGWITASQRDHQSAGGVVVGGGSVGGFTIPGIGVYVPPLALPGFSVPSLSVPKLVTGPTSPIRTVQPPLPTPVPSVGVPSPSVSVSPLPSVTTSPLPSVVPSPSPSVQPSVAPSATPTPPSPPSSPAPSP